MDTIKLWAVRVFVYGSIGLVVALIGISVTDANLYVVGGLLAVLVWFVLLIMGLVYLDDRKRRRDMYRSHFSDEP